MPREQNETGWTVIFIGLFMSYLFLPSFRVVDVKNREVKELGSWENKTTTTMPEHIGIMVAELVYDPCTEHMVFLKGDTISYRRLADMVEAQFGVKFAKALCGIPML